MEIWILYKGEVREGDFEDSELGDCEYFLLGDNNSNVYLPLWPAEDYAQLFRTSDIELEDFQLVLNSFWKNICHIFSKTM